MESYRRTYVMLRPMAAGASGFARLETGADHLLVQWQGKGLRARSVRTFAYGGEGAVKELGVSPVDESGQASLLFQARAGQWGFAPDQILALFTLSDEREPKPLLIGQCTRQSGGGLLDAKNAMLALCARMGEGAREREREAERQNAPAPAPKAAEPTPPPAPEPEPEPSAPLPESQPAEAPAAIPQEVFLPAVDPRVYVTAEKERIPQARTPALPAPQLAKTAAMDVNCAEPAAQRQEPPQDAPAPPPARAPRGRPVDRLRPACWPDRLRGLEQYFAAYRPFAPFDAPGWRFVRVPMGGGGCFAVGRLALGGEVRQIAYALPGGRDQPPPPELSAYRYVRGRDGQGYWAYWQDARD
ncbi:MAG: hypothetical protein PHY12_02400 [Eubacteriales bacterium]|nr:hypothetical protein [Eubacteriales bacterium]